MNGYKVSIKREVIDALRDAIKNDYSDHEVVDGLHVTLEYPTTELQYPTIMITLNENTLQLAGVGHYETGTAESGATVMLRHFRFEATLTFTIYALSALDRDELSAILVGILAFPESSLEASTFHTEIYDSDFIDMQIGTGAITPSGDQVSEVPWDDPTRRIYSASYAVPIIGEFWTHANGVTLTTINDIRLYPYRPGQQDPTGSNDPRDADVPWTPEDNPAWTPLG